MGLACGIDSIGTVGIDWDCLRLFPALGWDLHSDLMGST